MTDEQDRRISECERRIERLFGTTEITGQKIAVIESKMENLADAIKDGQTATNNRIEAMNADVKATSETSHRRTAIIVTVGLGALMAVLEVASMVLGRMG